MKTKIPPTNDLSSETRHPARTSSIIGIVVSFVLLLGMTGCAKSTRISTRAAGHEINAVITGDHSIETQSDQGVISSPFGKVVIERARVKLDDAPWLKIPEDVSVEVKITRSKLWLSAGRVTTSRTIQ
jgi:hypothetical protein